MNTLEQPISPFLICTAPCRGLAAWLTLTLLCSAGAVRAQTNFIGSWDEHVGGVYSSTISETADYFYTYTFADGSTGYYRPGYIFVGLRYDHGTLESYAQWREIISEPTTTHHASNEWSVANAWSNGRPDATTDARIVDGRTGDRAIQLPGLNADAATARSLTVYDADNTFSQTVTLSNGTLNLTPTSVFDTSLRVGAASAMIGNSRSTTLTLDAATLTSSAYAAIGKGLSAGAGGALQGNLNLENGSQWLHPAGLVEIGGEGGSGSLHIDSDGLLAGSLLAGAATDPRVVVHPGGDFSAAPMSTVRLSELLVNAGDREPGYPPLIWAARISGTFDAGLFHLGETVQGTAYATASSNAKFGQVILERASWLDLLGTAVADSIEVRDGVLKAASLTVGTAGGDGTTTIMTLGRDSGSSALLQVPATPLGGSAKVVTVHGAAQLGQAGTANVQVLSGSTLDIRGNLTLAGSSATGTATLDVEAGSTVSAQSIEVGTNSSDLDYGGSPSSPFPAGQATIKMQGGTLAITGTAQELSFPFPHTIYSAGALTFGSNDRLEGYGTIAFTNPNPEVGSLRSIGLIIPGSESSAGELLVQGDVMLSNGTSSLGPAAATLYIDLGGTAAGEFDVLHITGNADITNAILTLSFLTGPAAGFFSPQAGDTFYFLPVDGMLTGMFASLIDQTGLGLTLADLSMAETGGMMLTIPASAIPEPGTWAALLGLAALAAAALRRRTAQ